MAKHGTFPFGDGESTDPSNLFLIIFFCHHFFIGLDALCDVLCLISIEIPIFSSLLLSLPKEEYTTPLVYSTKIHVVEDICYVAYLRRSMELL